MQNLLQEQVAIKDMLTIVETLSDYGLMTKDPELLTEYVRHKLSRSIISPHIGSDGLLNLISLSQGTEDLLLKNIKKTEHGSYLTVDPKIADPFIHSIKSEAEKAMAKNIQPILLTTPTLRRHLRKMIEYFIPSLTVLSQSELLGDVRIKTIGEVNFNNAN